jgi:hypothetical protein
MPLVEIPDKQMTVEFPDTMTAGEIEKAILADVYGQKEAPVKDSFDMGVSTDMRRAERVQEPEELSGYGNRSDGTPKGKGFLGELKRPDGKVSTELSIGVNFDGKETEIPSLVPTLTKPEIDHLLNGGQPTKQIIDKAVEHARSRMSQGKSPFKEQADDFSPAISTITNKPIPTAEEKFRQSDFITSAPATAAGITASIPTGIAAGYVGLLRLATTGDLDKTKAMMDEINAQPGKFIKTPEQQRVVENISQALMYLPEKGKEVMGKIAEAELQRLSPEDQKRLGAVKPIMETAGEFGVLAAFPMLKKAVGKSTWYRMLSNEERGLVIQSLDDVLRNNPNMTEGEILRKWDNPNFKREALARRMKTEQETPFPQSESTPQAISKPTGLPISDLQKAIAKQAISETLAQNGLTPETFLQIANRTESLARKSSLETLPSEASAESSETSGQVPIEEVKPAVEDVKPEAKEPWQMTKDEIYKNREKHEEYWRNDFENTPGKYSVWFYPEEGINKSKIVNFADKKAYDKWIDAGGYNVRHSGRLVPEDQIRTYYRKGYPQKSPSYNYRDSLEEPGVSAYSTPEATSFAGLQDGEWYYGKGRQTGTGSDSEPTIVPIGKWKKWVDHETTIKQALKEGKPVPPEVLKDYPDLVKGETNGEILLEDGVPVKVDPFDTITVDGIKKSPAEEVPFGDKKETLPDGSTVNWDKEKVIEKDGLKGTYYPTYKKDGSFKSWHTKTEIDRLKSLKGVEGLNLKQDNYGKQTEIKGKTTGKQAGLGLEIEDKNQPGMFGKSRKSYGDSSIKSESSIKRTPAEKKPDINRETPKDIKPVAAMKMPELLQIYKEITGGKYPKIKEILGRLAERQGVFRRKGDDSDIYLKADIFANEQEALETLAHEMGHWIDYIPDKTMSRGNILGRIASLKHYADHWLDDILGGKGRLTDAEKKYFKNEAKKMAGGEKWIDEVIEKTLPITPDDILDIWNSGMPREALHPELLDYIQRLSSAEKKAIVVAAMKGIVPEDVKKFAYIAKEHTGKKIKVKIKASDQEVMDKYSELIANELKKRNIYNLNEIKEELKAFTNEWRPFDPAADSQYTKYRYSGKELYADAMSGLLTDPGRLRVIAPKFWSAWFSWIHRKPEFKAVWNAWQDKIGQGAVEVTKERMANIYDMFEKNDEARIDALMKEREGSMVSAYDGLMTYFWDKNHKALGLLNSLEKEGGLRGSHAENTRYLIEESNYIASEISVYVGDVYEHIMNPLESMGYDAKELGLVLFQKRVLGDRSKIGNPLGHSPETTEIDIKNIETSIWGKEKSDALNAFADKLRTLRESFIFPILEEAGLATPDFMKIIRDTKSYATFSNIEWFKNKYGNGPGAGFYRQVGTLGEIENPLVSMILKDISLIRAARMNIAKRELSIDLFYSGALEPAKMRWSKDINGKVPVEPTDSKKALYSFLNQGKAEYYYASKKIVDMFKYAPVEAQQVATIWRYIAQPMRELLVSKNPIWMVRNVFRDVRQTMKNIPEVTLKDIPKLLIEYKKAFAETVKDVYGKERSLDIREMMNDKALPINRIWTAFDETIESELDRIATELNFSRKQNLDAPTALKAIKFVWDNLDKIGRISEVWGKLAGYKYLKKYSDRDQKQISHVVRSRVGTPDYRRIGTGQQLTNNIFMFSNVGKEGIRSAIESAVEDPGGYAWKTLWLNIMPKLMMAGAGSGALLWAMSKMGFDAEDEDDMKKVKTLQRAIEGISEYDRSNYTIIPLGITDKGKSAYLRIPEDYEGQFWGALAHKLMTGRLTGHEGVSNLVLEQQPYKFHPYAIAINRLITYYIKGQNPVEEYSGRNIMTDATYTVGGLPATKAMGKSTWKELGLSLVYEPAWDGLERSETAYEKTLKTFPLNSLGTFLRFSDQGITEKIENELKTIRKEKALETIAFNEAFVKLANGETLTGDEALAILSKPAHQQKEKLLSLIGRKYGDAYLRQLTRPNLSKDEKAIIFSMMLKDRRTQEKKP